MQFYYNKYFILTVLSFLFSDTPDSRGTVGILKIVLTLFCGSKTADKAKCKC